MPNYFEFAYVNLTHGYIYLFANYFIAIGVPLALGDFDRKPRWKCALILIAEMAACLVVMELFAALYFTVFRVDTYVPFVCGLLVTALYALIRCKRKPAVKIMRACTYFGMACVGLTLTMSMGALLGVPYYYLQWVLISLNGMVILSGALLVRFFNVKEEMPCAVPYVFAVAVSGVLCFVFAILRRTLNFDPAASIAVSVILLFLNLLVYFVICLVVRKSYEDAYGQARIIMRNADRDAFRLSNENLENLHRMRHEIKNHYAVMKTFLEAGDYEKLKKYFSEYSEKIEKTVEFTDCGNDTLNAIIGIEQGRVRGAGAKFSYKIAVPEKLNINDVDLCSLIMNLINNAAEYYERSGPVGGNEIILEVVLLNNTLLVKVVNDILPEHAECALALKTCKKNKKAHGYGSKIVAAITEKYNGTISYEAAEEKFTACAMLFCE